MRLFRQVPRRRFLRLGAGVRGSIESAVRASHSQQKFSGFLWTWLGVFPETVTITIAGLITVDRPETRLSGIVD